MFIYVIDIKCHSMLYTFYTIFNTELFFIFNAVRRNRTKELLTWIEATLLKVIYIYPLFTELLTRIIEKHTKYVCAIKTKNTQTRKTAEYQFSMVVSFGINRIHFVIMSC